MKKKKSQASITGVDYLPYAAPKGKKYNSYSQSGSSGKKKLPVIVFAVIGGLLAVAGITLAVLTAINSVAANEAADGFVKACRSGDSSAMEAFLPGVYAELPEDIQALLDEVDENDDDTQTTDQEHDLQKLILTHSRIDSSSVITLDDDATLKLTINGPDMKKIMEEISSKYLTEDDTPKMDSEAVYADVQSMIESGKYSYSHDAEIPMSKIGGKWYVKYNNPEITDALTGGLQTAYSELYRKAFDELMEYFGLTEQEEPSDEN